MTLTNNGDGDRGISLEPAEAASARSDAFAGMGLNLLMTAQFECAEPLPQPVIPRPQPGDARPQPVAPPAQPVAPRPQPVAPPAQPAEPPLNRAPRAWPPAQDANPVRPGDPPEPGFRPPVGDGSQIPLAVRERVQTLVDRLASADAAVRTGAEQQLAQLTQMSPRDGEYAALLIQQAMRNSNSPLHQRVNELMRDLNGDRAEVAERAYRDLRAIGPGIAAHLDLYQRGNLLDRDQSRRFARLSQELHQDGLANGINLNLFIDRVTRTGLERLKHPGLEGTFRNLVRELLTNGDQTSICNLLKNTTMEEMHGLAAALQAAFTNERMPRMYVSARMAKVPREQKEHPTLVISTSELGEPGTQMRINNRGEAYIINSTARHNPHLDLIRALNGEVPETPPWNFGEALRDLRNTGLIPGYESRREQLIRQWREAQNRQNVRPGPGPRRAP